MFDEILYLPPFVSDGTCGSDWIPRLERSGCHVSYEAKQLLLSPSFYATNGIITEVVLLEGWLFPNNDDRTTKKICAKADKHKFFKPRCGEIACLISELLSNKEVRDRNMKSIVFMHEFRGRQNFFVIDYGITDRWLTVRPSRPNTKWLSRSAFAFEVRSQQKRLSSSF